MNKAAVAVAAVVLLVAGSEGRGTDAAPLAGHVDAPLETGVAGSGSQPTIRVLVTIRATRSPDSYRQRWRRRRAWTNGQVST